jgi:hypothetical protein
MRILVAWDDPAEAELIDTFLNVDPNECFVFSDVEELECQSSSGRLRRGVAVDEIPF